MYLNITIVAHGPPGSGKSTVLAHLMRNIPKEYKVDKDLTKEHAAPNMQLVTLTLKQKD